MLRGMMGIGGIEDRGIGSSRTGSLKEGVPTSLPFFRSEIGGDGDTGYGDRRNRGIGGIGDRRNRG